MAMRRELGRCWLMHDTVNNASLASLIVGIVVGGDPETFL